MQSKIGNWGGSSAIRVPRAAMERLGLREGQTVDLEIRNEALVIRSTNPHFSLEELLSQAEGQEPPVLEDDEPVVQSGLQNDCA